MQKGCAMALYTISYDIAEGDEAEYAPLWECLQEIGAVRILYSQWIVKAGVGQAVAIYNEVAPLTKKRDSLLVQEVTRDAQGDNLLLTDAEFLEFLASARG